MTPSLKLQMLDFLDEVLSMVVELWLSQEIQCLSFSKAQKYTQSYNHVAFHLNLCFFIHGMLCWNYWRNI